jgi:DNA-binding XRE family transcriptional regulator
MTNQTPSSTDFNPKILGHNIKEGRKRMGNMPQKELADLAGISRHTLIDIESGRRDTSLYNIVEIAKHLNTPLLQLLGSCDAPFTCPKHANLLNEELTRNSVGNYERKIFETLIEYLQAHIASLEKACADLRRDKAALQEKMDAYGLSTKKNYNNINEI